MSTKTTIKRIALVAVASLGFGLLSVAPSNAAPSDLALFPTVTPLVVPSTAAVASPVKATFNHSGVVNGYGALSLYTKAYLVAIPVTSALVPNAPAISTYTGTAYTATTGTTGTAGNTSSGASNFDGDYNAAFKTTINAAPAAGASARINGYFDVTFTPDVAGTYVVAIKSLIDGTQVATWSVTAAAPDAITAAGSTVLIAAGANAPTADTDALAVTATKVATGADEAARISVVAGNSKTADNAIAGTLSASISGSGLITWVSGRANGVRATSAASAGKSGTLYVYSDNTSGVGTITISSGSTVLATKTVTFYGDVASVTVTPMAKSIVDMNAVGAIATNTTSFVGVVSAKDAAGVTVPVTAGAFTVSSSTEKTAQSVTDAAAVSGVVAATYNGVKVSASSVVLVVDPTDAKTGAKTLTLTHTATKVATTFGFSVALSDTTTLSLTNNQGSTVPGQKITYTVTSKDAGGNPTPDGDHLITVATSLSQSMNLPTSVKLSGGVGTFDLYAPVTPGTQTVTVTSDFVSATTTSDIADLVQPAADAAAEATDAANAATDAANAAAEAADAATAAAQDAADAVAALATQVAEMIASLKAQITALTNLVIKIQKKVKA